MLQPSVSIATQTTLKLIDILRETSKAPRIWSEVDAALKTNQTKDNIDDYLKTRQQRSPFLSKLKQRLLLTPIEASCSGTCYNVPLINSLVLYVGMQASQLLQPQNISLSQPGITNLSVNEAALDIFKTLAMGLDSEGRYVFLNAIANQLRYPNSHTGYFSYILCCLFSDAHQVIVKEQITRVLVEQLTVEKPHPWGLLVTLSELMKNSKYNFWNDSFTQCVPEIQDLLESA